MITKARRSKAADEDILRARKQEGANVQQWQWLPASLNDWWLANSFNTTDLYIDATNGGRYPAKMERLWGGHMLYEYQNKSVYDVNYGARTEHRKGSL